MVAASLAALRGSMRTVRRCGPCRQCLAFQARIRLPRNSLSTLRKAQNRMGRRRGSRYDGSSKRSGRTRRSARLTENKLVNHVRHRFAASRRRLNHGPGSSGSTRPRGSASSCPTTDRQTSFATSLRSSGRATTRFPKAPPSPARSCKGKKARRSRISLTSTPRPRPSCPRGATAPAAPAPEAFRPGATTSPWARPRRSRARSSSTTSARSYGFVTPDSGGQDVFIHAKVLARSGLRRSGASAARAAGDHARPARAAGRPASS